MVLAKYKTLLVITSFSLFITLSIFLVTADGGGSLIKLDNPTNNTLDVDGNIVFSYNFTNSTYPINNCSLILDGLINQTNLTVTSLNTQYFYSYNLANGTHNWSLACTHSNNSISYSETRKLDVLIDTTPPTVYLNGPSTNSTDTDGNVTFNYTVNDDGWVTKCNLYTNITGDWDIYQTNDFVQKNTSLYFEATNISDNVTFQWNVVCYDYSASSNLDWGDNNLTLTIYDNPPTSLVIPSQTWQEDNYTILNLGNYFLDIDGDNLTYNFTSPLNISISINNSFATLKSDPNWYGNSTITFYAFDIRGKNVSSNLVTLGVNQAGDTPPNYIYTSPDVQYNDTYGYLSITCNATDDYGLTNISIYTDITGSWHRNQTKLVGGSVNSSNFVLSTLSEQTSYKWACAFYDNNSQISWSQNNTVNVSIKPDLFHDIRDFTINHIDYNRTITVAYSSHLNTTIILGNLTVYLVNGSVYFNKDLSTTNYYSLNDTNPTLSIYANKVRIKYAQIFQGNYSIDNEALLNITLQYYYLNNSRSVVTNHLIKLNPALPQQ